MTSPVATVGLAKSVHLNMIEAVNYEVVFQSLASQTASDTLDRIDKMVQAARNANMYMIWNLSGYGHSLNAQATNICTYDWGSFLTTIANHVNPYTGVKNSRESTIGMIVLMGEIPAPNGSDPGRGTTAETLEFFNRTLTQAQAAFPNHLVTTGGLNQLDWNSGIPWQAILDLPQNPIAQTEINSYPDRDTTIPMFTAYAQGLGKPWQLAAFSSCQGTADGSWDINHWPGDAEMAQHHREMYQVSAGITKATYPSIGAQFWNLANAAAADRSCDIGPQYPLTFAEVQSWAP